MASAGGAEAGGFCGMFVEDISLPCLTTLLSSHNSLFLLGAPRDTKYDL